MVSCPSTSHLRSEIRVNGKTLAQIFSGPGSSTLKLKSFLNVAKDKIETIVEKSKALSSIRDFFIKKYI